MPTTPPHYDGSDGGPIDLTKAKLWVQNFKDSIGSPNETRSHYFGRDVIDKILLQGGCTGLRIYYAINDAGEKELIISGVNNTGENQLPVSPTVQPGDNTLADFSFPCPPTCPPLTNDL